ncbi:hypothetical protein PM082_001010 [Marasmius tenuissimus]|nr:hypothetical protein PM082_001010 [Marasmius tenuissimus]
MKNTAMAMTVLAASFAGFYYSLKARDSAKRELGKVDEYESTYMRLRSQPHYPLIPNAVNPGDSYSVKPPVHEHDAKHHTIPHAKNLGTLADGQPILQPAPQRPKDDGSGLVYTKKA